MGCRKIDGVSNISDLLVCTRPPRVVSIFEPSLFLAARTISMAEVISVINKEMFFLLSTVSQHPCYINVKRKQNSRLGHIHAANTLPIPLSATFSACYVSASHSSPHLSHLTANHVKKVIIFHFRKLVEGIV